MKYTEVFDKMEELSKTGKYTDDQLEAIKYAYYVPDFDASVIINPSIPASYMLMYVKLSKNNKIDITKYINESWHTKGFDSNQLYYLISSDSKGQDISGINPSMSVDEIIKIIKDKLALKREKELLNDPKYSQLNGYGLDLSTLEFLSTKIDNGEDISVFFRPDINKFTSEQIKYLYSVYSAGSDINRIYNPNLTVDQMKEKMLSSPESVSLVSDIYESHNNRKNNIM